MFFANSNVKWMSVKVLLQQWDLPLRINVSLNGRESKKYGAKHFRKTFLTEEEVFNGLNKDTSIKISARSLTLSIFAVVLAGNL